MTDNHNSDYPIRLSLGVHLIELEDTNPTLPTSGSKAVPDEHTKTAELLTKHTPDFHIQYILQDLEVIEKILARNTLSQSDVFAQGLRYCECIRQRLHIMDSAFDTEQKKEQEMQRLVTLSDGTGMGDTLYVFDTNAPVDVLKDLEKVSNEAYANGNDDDVPIWGKELKTKRYTFCCIDEHQHVTPYGTSSEWLEERYSGIKEHYTIENQHFDD